MKSRNDGRCGVRLRNFALLAASLAMSGDYPKRRYSYRTPKDVNKYKLTSEEIELMETMTPKEKKKFLKGRV
jgi:hypothetical protein